MLGDTTEGLSEDPGYVGVHHGTGQYEDKQCAWRIKWRMEGKTHLMELNCVLFVVYESTDAPGTVTWLFTTFAYGKSGRYEHICRKDGRQVHKGAKMISSHSSVGGAEVSAPALQHAQHKDFEYKQKQELGCLGGRMYMKIEDEGDEEPPGGCRDHANGASWGMSRRQAMWATTPDQRTVGDLCPQVSSAARAAVQQGVKPKPQPQEAQIVHLGKENDRLQQRVDHLQSSVEVLQEAAAQAKAETAGLRRYVVGLRKENTRVQSERDNALHVSERAVIDATWLWQLVDRLGGDSPARGSRHSWHRQPKRDTERDPLTNLQGSAKELGP